MDTQSLTSNNRASLFDYELELPVVTTVQGRFPKGASKLSRKEKKKGLKPHGSLAVGISIICF